MLKPFVGASFGIALLSLSAGCPLLEIKAEVPEVCLTYRNVHVAGVSGAPTTYTNQFSFDDLSAVKDLAKLDANLEFVRAEVRATSGITSLDFVTSAHLAIASGDPSATLPTLEVLDCDGDCLTDGTTLEVPAAIQHDAVAYLETGSLVIDLSLAGKLPEQDWTMDVDLCLKGNVDYTLEP